MNTKTSSMEQVCNVTKVSLKISKFFSNLEIKFEIKMMNSILCEAGTRAKP
jgi:hypothetical protein